MLIGVLVGAIACVYLWTGNFAFIDSISLPEEKSAHFATYYMLLQFNGIAAHTLNFIFYSFEANTLYCFMLFFVIYILTVISIPFVLPDTESYDPKLDP